MEVRGSYIRIFPSLHNVAHFFPSELHAKLNICHITTIMRLMALVLGTGFLLTSCTDLA